MQDETVKIRITQSSFYFELGLILDAVQDDDSFVIVGGLLDDYVVSDGEAELVED